MAEKTWKAETIAVQGAYEPGNGDPRVVPLALSTTFAYDSAQDVADLFDLKTFGHFYTRLSNPTVAAFEGKMCHHTRVAVSNAHVLGPGNPPRRRDGDNSGRFL